MNAGNSLGHMCTLHHRLYKDSTVTHTQTTLHIYTYSQFITTIYASMGVFGLWQGSHVGKKAT